MLQGFFHWTNWWPEKSYRRTMPLRVIPWSNHYPKYFKQIFSYPCLWWRQGYAWLGLFISRVFLRQPLWMVLTILYGRKFHKIHFLFLETIFCDDHKRINTQRQMAILLDEYGGMAGLVTLEDLLEEIRKSMTKQSRNRFIKSEKILILFKAPWISMILWLLWCWTGKDDVDTIAIIIWQELGLFQRLRNSKLWISK